MSAAVVGNTGAKTLQGFVGDHAAEGATIYTDDHGGYQGMPFEHKTVKHSISEFVNGAHRIQAPGAPFGTLRYNSQKFGSLLRHQRTNPLQNVGVGVHRMGGANQFSLPFRCYGSITGKCR